MTETTARPAFPPQVTRAGPLLGARRPGLPGTPEKRVEAGPGRQHEGAGQQASHQATRHAYRDVIAELMLGDERIICLDTDTGLFSGTDFGAAAHRYVNIGIAEQNLMGMAAGLAVCGWIPFVNTMAAFASTRAAEAVKIDIAYNGLPVRIAATHGGLSAGHLGPTHHCLEDLAIMRALAGMTVVIPADAGQAADLVRQVVGLPGPVYLRLGRKATPPLPDVGDRAAAGRIQSLRTGGDVVIAACGPHPVMAALAAAEELASEGIEVTVLNVHTLKPFDTEGLLTAADGASLVVTAEEHWLSGGLGSAVSEVLAEHAPARVTRIGVPDTFAGIVGDHEDLLAHFGLTGRGIAESVRRSLRGSAGRR